MFNIPNTLSILRILVIPVFCNKFIYAVETTDYYIAAAILALSGITDILDGIIARRFNMITQFGKVIDPVADKMTLFAVCVCLWIKIPECRFMYMFFVAKELVIMLGSVLLMRKKVKLDGAKWFGKLYTVIFYIIMVLVVTFHHMPLNIMRGLMWFMGIFTIMSLAMYIPVFLKLNKSQTTKKV